MCLTKFKEFLEDEIKEGRLSKADIFQCVGRRVQVHKKVTTTGNKENERKITHFFNVVERDLLIEDIASQKGGFPNTEKLKSWFKTDTKASIEPVLSVYYWFHVFRKEEAVIIDHALMKGKTLKDYYKERQPEKDFSEIICQIPISEPQFTIEDWLAPDYYDNKKRLPPFFGRAEEIKQLNAFAKDDASFKIWAIAGPSGAGKTQLFKAWYSETYMDTKEHSAVKGWSYEPLSINDNRDWKEWKKELKCSTLLIIDYVFGFSETLKTIIELCRPPLPQEKDREPLPKGVKVRLLLVDHIFPTRLEDLPHDSRWNLDKDAEGFKKIRPHFFKPYPLKLKSNYKKEKDNQANLNKKDDQDYVIGSIIKSLAPQADASTIEAAKDYLKSQKNAWNPLFAVLVGDAIHKRKDYKILNRRQLIEHYLQGSKRLPWKRDSIDEKIASAFVAASTARRGVEFELLQSCVSENECQKLENEKKRLYKCFGYMQENYFQN